MKFYVDKKLQLRANENGWPELQTYEWHVGQGASGREYEDLCINKHLRQKYEDTVVVEYEAALEKAKAESLPMELTDQDRERLGLPCNCDCHKPGIFINHFIACCSPEIVLKADAFIDLNIEVVFGKQYKLAGSGLWVDSLFWTNEKSPHNETRTIARLKPANSAMGYTEGADIPSAPFPQNPQVSAVEGPWSDEYKNDIDISFYKEQVRILTEQLEAAEKRCKELEQDNAAGFEILQEKQIIINNYSSFFESIRGMVLEEFNKITDADNPYQALERAFDRLAIR